MAGSKIKISRKSISPLDNLNLVICTTNYVWLGAYCWKCRIGNFGRFLDPYKPVTGSVKQLRKNPLENLV